MQYSLALLTASPWPAISFGSSLDGEKARRDPRWNALVAQLAELREQGRRAIRMVDLNCGEGALLIEAAKQASRLGFLAIEGAGVDPDPDKISAARRRAGMLHDVAIGLEFEAMPPMERLAREAECSFFTEYRRSARKPLSMLLPGPETLFWQNPSPIRSRSIDPPGPVLARLGRCARDCRAHRRVAGARRHGRASRAADAAAAGCHLLRPPAVDPGPEGGAGFADRGQPPSRLAGIDPFAPSCTQHPAAAITRHSGHHA